MNWQEMSYATFWQVINGITSMGKSLSEELELIWKETVQRQEAGLQNYIINECTSAKACKKHVRS